jgi:hypothetical protein
MPKLPIYLLDVNYPADGGIYRGNINKPLPPEQPEHYPHEYLEERELRKLRYGRAKRGYEQPESPVPEWEQEKEKQLLLELEKKLAYRLTQRMRKMTHKDPYQEVLRVAPPADPQIHSTEERQIKRHIEENKYIDVPFDARNKDMVAACYPKDERSYVLFAELYYPNEPNFKGEPRRKECKVPAGL